MPNPSSNNLTANSLRKILKVDQFNRSELKKLIEKGMTGGPDLYRADIPVYEDGDGNEIPGGNPALLSFMEGHPQTKVFLRKFKNPHDLALEGGGAFGFAHMGTIHAMAMRGIWFDRVAGTSAGSLAAALIAGGYRVDVNYRTQTDTEIIGPLMPSPGNSLNQIMFDDQFQNFTDYEQRIDRVRQALTSNESVIYTFLNAFVRDELAKHFSLDGIKDTIALSTRQIKDAYFNFEIDAINAVLDFKIGPLRIGDIPGVGLTPQLMLVLLREMAAIFKANTTALINAIQNGTGPIFRAFDDAIANLAVSITDAVVDAILVNMTTKEFSLAPVNGELTITSENKLNQAVLAIFRLIEYGGFWEGNFLRDWMERHLQQLNIGTGPKLDGRPGRPRMIDGVTGLPVQAVLFKDLKMDLCIIAADMGPSDPDSDWTPIPIYFSRRTTPDYPVAEAVRRSMSLPFVFIPRRIDDGYGKNPDDISTLYSNEQHHAHLLQDGGLFINLPVAVFRDLDNFVFEVKNDNKPLVISNINSGIPASTRPDDIPECRAPEPIPSIKNAIKPIAKFASSLFPASNPPNPAVRASGIVKLTRSFEFIMGYAVNIHQEVEVNSLLRLVPNSFFVDIALQDPNVSSGSSQEFTGKGRLDSGDFAMTKTTKKWIVQNGFEAAKAAFLEFEADNRVYAGRLAFPASFNPYNHILAVSNVVVSNAQVAAVVARAKIRDACYSDPGSLIVKDFMTPFDGARARQTPLGNEVVLPRLNVRKPLLKLYTGMGCTWIKVSNSTANRNNSSGAFIAFDINMRSRVFIAIDIMPVFITEANGWRTESSLLILGPGSGIPSPIDAAVSLMLFSKVFERGRVVIPGPRNTAVIRNQFAYAILVRPV